MRRIRDGRSLLPQTGCHGLATGLPRCRTHLVDWHHAGRVLRLPSPRACGWNGGPTPRDQVCRRSRILSRADMILPEPVRHRAGLAAGCGGTSRLPRPAVELPGSIHVLFHSLPFAEQAAVIRQALPGTAGEPIAERIHDRLEYPLAHMP
jgi:hypothetical protein